MSEVIRKEGVKSAPLTITDAMKEDIYMFKQNMLYMYDRPELTSEFDCRTIEIVLQELDDYDKNFIIGFYIFSDGNIKQYAKLLSCTERTVSVRVNKILDKIKELNNAVRTDNNKPRINFPD